MQLGLYKHYKGNNYQTLAIAKHTETNEQMVVYKSARDTNNEEIWVRPLIMFLEEIVIDNISVKRFEFIGETNN